MQAFNVNVFGSEIKINSLMPLVSGGENQFKIRVMFSKEWEYLQKFLVFKTDKTYQIAVSENAIIPNEVLSKSKFTLSAIGVGSDKTFTTTEVLCEVIQGPYISPETLPTPTEWVVYIKQVEVLKNETLDARDNAKQSEINTKESEIKAKESELKAKESEDVTEVNKDITESNKDITETNKDITEVNKDKSIQALRDLLNMLGTDVATLTDGKLTASQIPNISINKSFLIQDESELSTLKAEIGDMAYQEDDEQKVIALWWLVGNNGEWKKLGLSFVAESGHSNTSDYADNANKINNKRIVIMTFEEFINGAKSDDIYFTYRG